MKKTFIAIFTCVLVLLSIGLSYAYFTGMIFGEKKNISVMSKELKIVFTDDMTLGNTEIIPGWKESKVFSVENESDETFNYNIVFRGLVNTFVTEGFLQYKITSSNGYNMEGYLDIPKSSTPTDIVLAYDIDIPVDVKQEYTIEFVYHDSSTVDQSEDMGKVLEGTLAIVEGTVDPNIKYTVTMSSEHGTITPESNETVKKGNLEFSVTPNTGYDVNTMSVSCTPVANTVITGNKIKVNDIRQNHNCEVSFDKELYTVNIVVNNGKSDALNKVIEYGGSGTATITPNYGYTLENATVEETGCSMEGDILSISNVQSNGTCTVTLLRDKYTVTLTGTGIASSNSPQEAEYEGSTTINFTLSEGYELGDNVINCDNGTPNISGNTLTVSNVTANTTCTLSPVLKSYDVTLKVVGGTPESETKSITHNGSGTYTIANSTGYKLELNGNITCTGNATGSLSGSTVTISGVTTTQTCTVNLKKQTYTVNVSSNNNSYGTVDPTSSVVSHGDNLEITLKPGTYYKYSNNDCGGTLTSENILTIPNITGNITKCTITFTLDTSNFKTLADTIKSAYPSSGPRTNFSTIYTTTALHTATDYDSEGNFNGTTYYFTGNPNNWVSFAGKLWRIIRINGNGSVRLLYAGSGSTDGTIATSSYSINGSTYDHPAYVGWKYSTNGTNGRGNSPSGVYNKIESWYNDLSSTDKNYIDTGAIYCNDRSVTNGYYTVNGSTFVYAAVTRLVLTEALPTLECDASDRFPRKDSNETLLDIPVGLMTADEVVLAGGKYNSNNESAYYYLNKDGGPSGGDFWWTMTPSKWDNGTNYSYAHVFQVVNYGGHGKLTFGDIRGVISVRPVISLKPNVRVTGGNGTGSEPYTLLIE